MRMRKSRSFGIKVTLLAIPTPKNAMWYCVKRMGGRSALTRMLRRLGALL